MANYLRTHPAVFLSDPKEPFYWADDMPRLRRREGIETPADYQNLFAGATTNHRVIGEASTLYLYSQTALPAAAAFNREMRFVFMLRRPDQIAHAFHMQMIFHESENEPHFETAWKLQSQRAADPSIVPPRCPSPRMLQYRDVASIGSQLTRALQHIDRSKVHLILFDDFKSNPGQCYRQLLQWLGLPDDNRQEFPKDNAAMKSNSVLLTRTMRSRPVRVLTKMLKGPLRGPAYGLARAAKHRLMFRPTRRDAMDRDFHHQLCDEFREEVALVEQILGRDLSHWKTPPQPVQTPATTS